MVLNGVEHTKIIGSPIISVCCVCSRVYDVKPAQGAAGGLSHGYCDPCLGTIMDSIGKAEK